MIFVPGPILVSLTNCWSCFNCTPLAINFTSIVLATAGFMVPNLDKATRHLAYSRNSPMVVRGAIVTPVSSEPPYEKATVNASDPQRPEEEALEDNNCNKFCFCCNNSLRWRSMFCACAPELHCFFSRQCHRQAWIQVQERHGCCRFAFQCEKSISLCPRWNDHESAR